MPLHPPFLSFIHVHGVFLSLLAHAHYRVCLAVQGSVPLGGRPALWVVPGSLAPYCTQQLPHYYFYFPRQADGTAGGGGASGYGCASDGELRAAFPAAAASRGRLLAAAADQPTHLRVRRVRSLEWAIFLL